jgi:hypothetical protein
MTVVPHPSYFSLFHPLKRKLKSHNFETTEVIEAESQAVLIAGVLGTVHMHGKGLLKG